MTYATSLTSSVAKALQLSVSAPLLTSARLNHCKVGKAVSTTLQWLRTGVGMFDFIQKLIYSFLNLLENFFGKKLKISSESTYSNTAYKKKFAGGVSLELTAETEKSKIKLKNDVSNILKVYENNPEKLIEFIQKSGTKVYRIPFASKILRLIGYEEGFIVPEGIKALCINIVIFFLAGEKFQFLFKTEPMFILRTSHIDSYYMIQHFHKWYARKLNLPGFDSESQNNFQKFLNSNDRNIKSLTVDEMLGLSEAIARDIEAINFIIDFAKSTAGSKNALKKIMAGGASV